MCKIKVSLKRRLAFKMNKLQGQMLDMAVINFGKKEACIGPTLVSLIRAKRIVDLVIGSMPFDRLNRLVESRMLLARLEGGV